MRIIVSALALIALLGCQTTNQSVDYNAKAINDAKKLVSDKKYDDAFRNISTYIYGDDKYSVMAIQMIASDSNLRDAAISKINENASNSIGISQLNRYYREMKKLSDSGAIDASVFRSFADKSNDIAIKKYKEGVFSITLSDDVSAYQSLSSSEIRDSIARNTLEKLVEQGQPDDKMVNAYFDYLSNTDKKNPLRLATTKSLGSIKFTTSQIQNTISKFYPDFAEKALSNRIISARVVIEPDDRLLLEDLADRLKPLAPALTIRQNSTDTTAVIKIKKIQWDESRQPDHTQTVIYGQGDVDFLAAVMLMPRNSSYLFDVSTGGISLNYAFEVSYDAKAQPHFDKLVREQASRSWTTCSNARIQNVFGGVQPASFVANPRMQQICNGGSSVTIQELRSEALSRIVTAISSIPQVESVLKLK